MKRFMPRLAGYSQREVKNVMEDVFGPESQVVRHEMVGTSAAISTLELSSAHPVVEAPSRYVGAEFALMQTHSAVEISHLARPPHTRPPTAGSSRTHTCRLDQWSWSLPRTPTGIRARSTNGLTRPTGGWYRRQVDWATCTCWRGCGPRRC